jgi:hypothetical protein
MIALKPNHKYHYMQSAGPTYSSGAHHTLEGRNQLIGVGRLADNSQEDLSSLAIGFPMTIVGEQVL